MNTPPDVVVLPVVHRKRRRGARRRELPAVMTGQIPAIATVVDLNAYRHALERARVERRSSRSLLPDLDMSPAWCDFPPDAAS